MTLKYDQPQPISRDEAERSLTSEDAKRVSETLIRIALSEEDWIWAEQKFLVALKDSRKEVRAAGLTSIGHLVRRHHALHAEKVLPAVMDLLTDPDTRGIAEDTLDDIACFVPNQGGPM